MKKKKKQKNALTEMMSGANGRLSSKRILGTFILLVLLTVIVIDSFWGSPNNWLGEAFITMLIGAFSLLGIGVFEKRYDLNRRDKDYQDYQDYQEGGEC